MLDNIINIVKEQASSLISENQNVPEDKKQAAVEVTTNSIVNEFQKQLSSGNISGLTAFFEGRNTADSNSAVSSFGSTVDSALTKIGLSPSVATSISSAVIPAVMKLISKKSNDPNDKFNIGSLIQSLTSNTEGKDNGGILGKLKNLFNK